MVHVIYKQTTIEKCPECGHQAEVDHCLDYNNTKQRIHIWHCPKCDPRDDGLVSTVLDECPLCMGEAPKEGE